LTFSSAVAAIEAAQSVAALSSILARLGAGVATAEALTEAPASRRRVKEVSVAVTWTKPVISTSDKPSSDPGNEVELMSSELSGPRLI